MTSESNGENLTEIFQILTSLVFMKNLKKYFKNFNLKIFQIHVLTTVVMKFFFKNLLKKINLKIFKECIQREKVSSLFVRVQCLYIFIFSLIQFSFEKSNLCQTKI